MSNLSHDNNLFHAVAGLRLLTVLLGAGRPVVAATLVFRDGAGAPLAETKIFVTPDGGIAEGAEGGLLERRIAARGAAVLASGQSEVFDFAAGGLTDEQKAVYGNIAQVFLERIVPDRKTLGVFEQLRQRLARGLPGLLLSSLEPGDGPDGTPVRSLLWPGRLVGDALPERVIRDALLRGEGLSSPCLLETGAGRFFLEPYAPLDAVYVAGAGKVSRRLVPLATLAGFRVVVLDVDAAFANRDRFPQADEVVALGSFDGCFSGRTVDASSSVVVATRGHAFDREVLAQALRTEAGYVGMMGCRADGRARLEELLKQGFSEAAIGRVHTPIGLPIGGGSPEESAMSIVAELIQCRTQRRKRGR